MDRSWSIIISQGRLAQLARAPRLHRGCRGFESLIAHKTYFHLFLAQTTHATINPMSDYVTQKQLEKSLGQYQATILEAVSTGFKRSDKQFEEARQERAELRESINKLTTTLDAFLKRLTDFEDEFSILKAEMAQVKTVLKEKFDIEISLQGK